MSFFKMSNIVKFKPVQRQGICSTGLKVYSSKNRGSIGGEGKKDELQINIVARYCFVCKKN